MKVSVDRTGNLRSSLELGGDSLGKLEHPPLRSRPDSREHASPAMNCLGVKLGWTSRPQRQLQAVQHGNAAGRRADQRGEGGRTGHVGQPLAVHPLLQEQVQIGQIAHRWGEPDAVVGRAPGGPATSEQVRCFALRVDLPHQVTNLRQTARARLAEDLIQQRSSCERGVAEGFDLQLQRSHAPLTPHLSEAQFHRLGIEGLEKLGQPGIDRERIGHHVQRRNVDQGAR